MNEQPPNIRERRFDVDQNFDGWRLDNFLANRISRVSRTRAQEIVKHGDLELVPHRRPKPSTVLHAGDVVILREHLPPERTQYDEVEVLYRDDAVLVLNKPAGMLVHEAASVRLNTIQMYLAEVGLDGAEPVHRIDRETSGVLVCAAVAQWVPPLRDMFAREHPDKIYRAIVDDPNGLWDIGLAQTVDTPLGLDTESALGIRMIEGPLDARTHVTCLARRGSLADLQVRIETGRQHQIRAHLSMFGTPIAGDKLYTFDDAFFMEICDRPDDPELLGRLGYPRHLLHAWKIAFPHPVDRRTIEVEAPLPALWDRAPE